MTGRINITEDNIFPRLVAGSLIMSAALGAALALIVAPRFGASLFVGGLLATGNFIWIRRGLEAVLTLNPTSASRFATLRFLLRLAIMAGLLYLVIVVLGADVIGVIIGLSILVVNVIILSIYLSTRKGG